MADPVAVTRACAGCGSELPATFLACPSCGRLVHADELKRLAAEAQAAETAGDPSRAQEQWRLCLDLVPRGSKQALQLEARLATLARQTGHVETAAEKASKNKWMSRFGGLGALGLALWKFKWLVVFALTKGKLLVLGLFKLPTLLSILFAFGAYFSMFGWKFAVGLLASIYVHEMGHVNALRRYGVAASAPMFVPGLGAFVRLKQNPNDPHVDARVGLAGPIWGLGAALAAFVLARVFESPAIAAIAHLGAWINVFNLIPVWQLDGSRGFRALTQSHRWMVAATAGVAWGMTGETMALIVAGVAAWRAFRDPRMPVEQDRTILFQFVGLILLLSAVGAIDPLTLVAR